MCAGRFSKSLIRTWQPGKGHSYAAVGFDSRPVFMLSSKSCLITCYVLEVVGECVRFAFASAILAFFRGVSSGT